MDYHEKEEDLVSQGFRSRRRWRTMRRKRIKDHKDFGVGGDGGA